MAGYIEMAHIIKLKTAAIPGQPTKDYNNSKCLINNFKLNKDHNHNINKKVARINPCGHGDAGKLNSRLSQLLKLLNFQSRVT